LPRFGRLVLSLVLAVASGCGSMFVRADALSSPPVLLAGQPAPALPRAGIDVLVWNVKKAQRAAWGPEFAALARGKELVLLQEAYVAPRMIEPLAARSELQWLMGPSFVFARQPGEPATGVVVGSAAAATSHEAFVTVDTEPLVGTPKAALAATYALEGSTEPLLVVSIHGINFRRAHALVAQLDALEPVIAAHRGPVIFAGDLNTHHRPRMAAVEAFAARLQLEPAFDNRPSCRRSASDGRTRFGRWPLDHVYVRGLVVEEAGVVETTRGSDHAPLIVRVSSE
jgi:endonuclease/exonuclease/phosphatase (EEP) superfamily protein YafD